MDISLLVVGAGPVGATLALELARHGVSSTVIDRQTGPSRHPKMDFLNARSMELFHRLGVAETTRNQGVDGRHPFRFIWARSLTDPIITEWSFPSVQERLESYVNDGTGSRQPYQRLQGSRLEGILRRELARHPLIEFLEDHQLVDLRDNGGSVTATVEVASSETRTITARYVVGCDGGASRVRQASGIDVDMIGPSTVQCDVYFRSEDPRLTEPGPFFLGVLASGVTLVSRNGADTWTGSVVLPEGLTTLEDPVGYMIERLGTEIEIDQVMNIAYWRGQLAVADRYRSGRVFLAGDAAHQFFPTGGHGANTGLEDAANLGWKLAAVVQEWSGPELLDSYELERRPVALFNREMCFNLLEVWRRFPALAAVGATDEQLAGFLTTDSYQVSNTGIHFGSRYEDSPIVVDDGSTSPPWRWDTIVASTKPGIRVPSMRTAEGDEIFDLFGVGYTLVDFTDDRSGQAVVDAAKVTGVPVTYLPMPDPTVESVWQRKLVLIRPDQHVAWRDDRAPTDWLPILDRCRGVAADRILLPA